MSKNDPNKFITGLAITTVIFILVLVFGIVITNIMAYVARDSTITDVTGVTVATNGSLTNFGASYPYVQDIDGCINATGTEILASANYTVAEGNAAGGGGFILSDTATDFIGATVNCTDVTYLKTTTATTAISGLSTGANDT